MVCIWAWECDDLGRKSLVMMNQLYWSGNEMLHRPCTLWSHRSLHFSLLCAAAQSYALISDCCITRKCTAKVKISMKFKVYFILHAYAISYKMSWRQWWALHYFQGSNLVSWGLFIVINTCLTWVECTSGTSFLCSCNVGTLCVCVLFTMQYLPVT